MTNYDLEESKLLKIQIGLSIIFIFTTIISISLSYNLILEFDGKNKIYSHKEADEILKINRLISFFVAFGFILINIYDKKIKEDNNLDNRFSDMQITASLFTLISSLIVLYVAFNSSSITTSNENIN